MRMYHIPETNLTVSYLSLGAGEFGGSITQKDAFYIMDTFCEAGGNLIDTAHIYCDWIEATKSESEKIIGRWLKASPYKNKVIISTKGAHPPLDDMHKSRLSSAEICTDCDESLDFLGIDSIPLYWLHRDDVTKNVGEIIETLNALKKAGKVQYFGASNWYYHRIEEANQYAQKHNLQGFCASQIQWSLANIDGASRGDDTLVVMDSQEKKAYLESQMTVMAYSSQAKGYFTKMTKERIDGHGIMGAI